jgi:hypothetical protein
MLIARIMCAIALTVATAAAAFAQDDCELTLTQATEEFQAGHFYSIPTLLNKCIDRFTLEQRQRAYMLLTQTYLLLDDQMGAKRSYMEVLRANPEFIADPNIHSIDVVYLSKKFTASPVFSFFGHAGLNISPIRVIHDNDVFGERYARETYQLTPGYQASIGADLYLLENIGLRGELQYMFATYQHNSGKFFEEDTKLFTERQSWASFPVTVLYHDNIGKYRPYGYAGYQVGYLFRDVASITVENIRGTEIGKDEKESPDFNFLWKRNRWNQSIVFGGGVKMKMGLQFLFVDVRYTLGLKNLVNPDNLYTESGLLTDGEDFVSSGQSTFAYTHADDLFRLDNLSLSFGFLQPLYKPRELKRARTRSVMKNIKKNEGGK